MTRRSTLGAVLLLSGLVGVAAWLLLEPAPRFGGLELSGTNRPEDANDPASAPALAARAASGSRERVLEPAGATVLSGPAPDASPFAVLMGRCLDERGQPLSGCRARVFAKYPARQERSEGELARAHSGPDGRFALEVPEPTSEPLHVLAESSGCVTRYLGLGLLAAGERRELGDVFIFRGVRVSGRVQDEEGRAVPGVGLQFRGPPLPGTDQFSPDGASLFGARTEADGTFRVGRLLRVARWSVSVSGMGASLVRPEAIDLTDAPAAGADITVVVRQRASISGFVVDAGGLPVPGLQVRAEEPQKRTRLSDPGPVTGLGTVSGTDGAFVVYPVAGVNPEARVVLALDTSRGFEPVDSDALVAWGSSAVRLSVRPAPSVDLEVLEAGSSKPLENFAVSVTEDGSLSFRNAGHHPLGRLRLEDLRRARYSVYVLPEDPRIEPAERPVDLAGGGAAALQVRLAPAPTLLVRVSDVAATPVAGTSVTLVDPKGASDIGISTTVAHAFATNSIFAYRPSDLPIALHIANTDAAGHALLRLPRGAARLFLRLEGSEHVPLVRLLDGADLARGSVDVTVSRGARLHLRVKPDSVLRYRPVVRLGRPDRRADEQMFPQDGVPLRGDGTCELLQVPPGEWDVFLCGGRFALGGALHRVRLSENEVSRIEISAANVAPGSLDGQVVLAGEASEAARVRLTLESAPRSILTTPIAAVVGERVSFPLLLPGRYKAELLIGKEERVLEASEGIEIESGVVWSRAISFRPRSR